MEVNKDLNRILSVLTRKELIEIHNRLADLWETGESHHSGISISKTTEQLEEVVSVRKAVHKYLVEVHATYV